MAKKEQNVVGWKTLRADGSSLSNQYERVYYPLPTRKGRPGRWKKVPGNGAYVAVTDGLFVCSVGDILVSVEGREEVHVPNTPPGVLCFRHVRVLAVKDWTELPLEQAEWRYKAACYVPGLSDETRAHLVTDILLEQTLHKYDDK